ncbi:hypothetical protein D1159_12835 [Pseudoflavonifractor sp. 524-17]|nr:hypothetical protein [Pseudoflavonifractor sp. 524-17]
MAANARQSVARFDLSRVLSTVLTAYGTAAGRGGCIEGMRTWQINIVEGHGVHAGVGAGSVVRDK